MKDDRKPPFWFRSSQECYPWIWGVVVHGNPNSFYVVRSINNSPGVESHTFAAGFHEVKLVEPKDIPHGYARKIFNQLHHIINITDDLILGTRLKLLADELQEAQDEALDV